MATEGERRGLRAPVIDPRTPRPIGSGPGMHGKSQGCPGSVQRGCGARTDAPTAVSDLCTYFTLSTVSSKKDIPILKKGMILRYPSFGVFLRKPI